MLSIAPHLRRILITCLTVACVGEAVLLGLALRRAQEIDAVGWVVVTIGLGATAIVIALAVSAAIRARRLGAVVVRARWSDTRTTFLSLYVLMYMVVIGIAVVIMRSDPRSGYVLVGTCCFFASPLYYLLRLTRGVEIRAGGLVADLGVLAWHQVRSYEWAGEDRNRLTLHIDRSFTWLGSSTVSFPLKDDDLDAVDGALREHIGTPGSEPIRVYR